MPFRAFALPLRGALKHPVAVEYRYQRDTTEPGRAHDEIGFTWDASSRWLPKFRGVLRFRPENTETRVLLNGEYVPPIGALGAMFDRLVGRGIARATAEDLVDRLVRGLETTWTAERT